MTTTAFTMTSTSKQRISMNRRIVKLTFLMLTTTSIGSSRGILGLTPTNVNVKNGGNKNNSSADTNIISRRSCLTEALLVGGGFYFASAGVGPAHAADVIDPEGSTLILTESNNKEDNEYRSKLLRLITNNKKSDETEIVNMIENLIPLDPSQNKGALSTEDLDGEWKLLWSAKAEAFSPLLKLPYPFKPESFQYLGKASAGEVGPNRVAQGLTGGILGPSQLWLSSGVRPSSGDSSVLEILPPFRFELGGRYQSGKPKRLIVEAGSDAEFRKYNARTTEAQVAPKNSYRQLYLERQGKGSLRISTITAGDPVIVGAIFVHEKL
jgi:hypothetical protein